MSQLLVRQAVESDIPAILRLQHNWFLEESIHGYLPDTSDQIAAMLGPLFFIAEEDNRLVGFISGSIHESQGLAVIPKGKIYLEIENVYVIPQSRSSGIGGTLVDRILAQARQQEIPYVLVYSATKDIHAILKFYESHGFQSWYVQMFQKLDV